MRILRKNDITVDMTMHKLESCFDDSRPSITPCLVCFEYIDDYIDIT